MKNLLQICSAEPRAQQIATIGNRRAPAKSLTPKPVEKRVGTATEIALIPLAFLGFPCFFPFLIFLVLWGGGIFLCFPRTWVGLGATKIRFSFRDFLLFADKSKERPGIRAQ